jgi:hypothetical protein
MNYYALSALVNAITSLTLGGFIAIRGWRNPINRRFVFFAVSVGIWSAFYFLWQIEQSPQLALLWTRVLMGGAIWIPTYFLHFVVTLLKIRRKRLLSIAYGLTLLYFLADFTPWFITETQCFF